MSAVVPSGISIRVAKAHEYGACADVYRAAWRGMTFVPQGLHTHTEDLRWMQDVFRHQLVLVADAEDSGPADDAGSPIVGLLSMSEGAVHNLYILPDFQRKGIGHTLLETAKTCSGGELKLWVFEPNEGAIRFYQRHGFETMRKTDGRENEEKVPDRLMAWRMDR